MVDIGTSEKSGHKDKDIDNMTYIELSNSIKFLFDKLNRIAKICCYF